MTTIPNLAARLTAAQREAVKRGLWMQVPVNLTTPCGHKSGKYACHIPRPTSEAIALRVYLKEQERD